MMTISANPIELLLIEDNPADITLIEEALKEGSQNVHLHVVEDGFQAMDFLFKKGPYASAVKPDLIILDLNLPKKNGMEVLQQIKKDGNLKDIPLAVFTTSRSHADILKTYGLGGALFITKPLGFHEFMFSVKSIIQSLVNKQFKN